MRPRALRAARHPLHGRPRLRGQPRAGVQLTLPRTDVEAFDRLEEPAGAGVRAHLWQHRRPFFLVRLRAPGSVLSQLPLDLFELMLKEFIGTGYHASVYA